MSVPVDLPIDLNTQDDTGMPWTFLDAAPEPSKIREGAWIVVGGSQAQAVAQASRVRVSSSALSAKEQRVGAKRDHCWTRISRQNDARARDVPQT